jgi:REP element-mobilizing transposase RayT
MSQRFNRPDAAGVLHYVTLNVRERRPIFSHSPYALALLQCLRSSCDDYLAKLVSYVVMPDHMHFIVHPKDGKLSHFLSKFKPVATKSLDSLAKQKNHEKMRAWLRTERGRNLWQDGKHSFHLWSDILIWQKIHYIHYNPVRACIVDYPVDYLWSSYGAFATESGHQAPIAVDSNWWWEN